jgi:hypothetical protein
MDDQAPANTLRKLPWWRAGLPRPMSGSPEVATRADRSFREFALLIAVCAAVIAQTYWMSSLISELTTVFERRSPVLIEQRAGIVAVNQRIDALERSLAMGAVQDHQQETHLIKLDDRVKANSEVLAEIRGQLTNSNEILVEYRSFMRNVLMPRYPPPEPH